MNAEERLKQDGYEGVEPVLFYSRSLSDPRWACFSNFSRDPVDMVSPWTGETVHYLTTEHRYQAMKADNQEDHDWVVAARGPGESKKFGRRVSMWENWGHTEGSFAYLVMLECVLEKARQNPAVLEVLRMTKKRPMYEDSPTDDIWGWRFEQDHRGNNLLGIAWMQARSLLLG